MPIDVDSGSLFGSGLFTNGVYNWRVRAVNSSDNGLWSDTEMFTLDIHTPSGLGAPRIEGTVYYHGEVVTSNILVQAYLSPGIRGEVQGQISMNGAGDYVVNGLQNDVYCLRAFIDLNTNNAADEWEPQGIARDASFGNHYAYRADAYGVGTFDLSQAFSVNSADILIRDRDTDNDNVPDGWDWINRPVSLQDDGFVTLADDIDGDGVMLVDEYGYGSNPYSSDTDGDGLSDGIEIAFGTALSSGDSDGDGAGDLMEIAAGASPVDSSEVGQIFITSMGIDPVTGEPAIEWETFQNSQSVDINYVLERSTDFVNWSEVGALVSYGDVNATFSIQDAAVADDTKGFYRLRFSVK